MTHPFYLLSKEDKKLWHETRGKAIAQMIDSAARHWTTKSTGSLYSYLSENTTIEIDRDPACIPILRLQIELEEDLVSEEYKEIKEISEKLFRPAEDRARIEEIKNEIKRLEQEMIDLKDRANWV